jgi:hypothetical protein
VNRIPIITLLLSLKTETSNFEQKGFVIHHSAGKKLTLSGDLRFELEMDLRCLVLASPFKIPFLSIQVSVTLQHSSS